MTRHIKDSSTQKLPQTGGKEHTPTHPYQTGHNPATGEHNDSLVGDYLWSNTNFGEAFPDVLTPITWSLVQTYIDATAPFYLIFDDPMIGNIGGRLYLNTSVGASMSRALGMKEEKWRQAMTNTFGRIPEDMEVPLVPLNRWKFLAKLIPLLLQFQRRIRRHQRELPKFLTTAPDKSAELDERIQLAVNRTALAALWKDEVLPYFVYCSQILHAATNLVRTPTRKLRPKLVAMVGETDTNALLSGISGGGENLASMGPLLGLWKVAQGEMSREEYTRRYGHRSAHEFELSIPRPAEDPQWLDQQLAALEKDNFDPQTMFMERQVAHKEAWGRLISRYPRESRTTRRHIERLSDAAQMREAVRSEVTRALWLYRKFALRAGEITGISEDIFYLYIEELLVLLDGDETALGYIPARKETRRRYSALPPYPNLIRGRFDPFQWAANPHRRSDFYDSTAQLITPREDTISGFPGAAGIVQGVVRVLKSPEEGPQLQTGEILVTNTTNIGWTPIFPRAAAIVTNVGAPLSHAAIVARELGIPAVVGCGNATMRLKTGDRVQVDGGKGTVKLLNSADSE
jgi:phosphohistidine swiveling domain-containing protein